METSTSDRISLGTDIFLSKFTLMEFTLSDTDGDSRWQIAFLYPSQNGVLGGYPVFSMSEIR